MIHSIPNRTTEEELQHIYRASVEEGELRTLVVGKDLSNQAIELPLLRCTDFVETDLTNAVLKGCDLRGAAFDRATLSHTRLVDCCVGGCTFPAQALVPGNEMLSFEGCSWNIVGNV